MDRQAVLPLKVLVLLPCETLPLLGHRHCYCFCYFCCYCQHSGPRSLGPGLVFGVPQQVWTMHRPTGLCSHCLLLAMFVDLSSHIHTRHLVYLLFAHTCSIVPSAFTYKTSSKSKLLRNSRWWQQSIKPNIGPIQRAASSATGPAHNKNPCSPTGRQYEGWGPCCRLVLSDLEFHVNGINL